MKIIHYWNLNHENRIPNNEENKQNGYKATACGYQRKKVTLDIKKVTCKQCIKTMKNKEEYNNMNNKDCKTCKHCIDKNIWTCEYDEPCIDHSLYESEKEKDNFNEIET